MGATREIRLRQTRGVVQGDAVEVGGAHEALQQVAQGVADDDGGGAEEAQGAPEKLPVVGGARMGEGVSSRVND